MCSVSKTMPIIINLVSVDLEVLHKLTEIAQLVMQGPFT